jgi:hypothetical protein
VAIVVSPLVHVTVDPETSFPCGPFAMASSRTVSPCTRVVESGMTSRVEMSCSSSGAVRESVQPGKRRQATAKTEIGAAQVDEVAGND